MTATRYFSTRGPSTEGHSRHHGRGEPRRACRDRRRANGRQLARRSTPKATADVRWCGAGTTVLSTPNGKRPTRPCRHRALVLDCYLNETTRHATVILPPPSPLERPHYDVAFHHLAVRNTAKFAPPLFAPPADQLEDHVAILELVRLLLKKRGELGPRERLSFAAMKRLGPRGLLEPRACGTPECGRSRRARACAGSSKRAQTA